ncbi:hypothetical protein [Thalassoglobus polymorphus]|uniref:hypothetical protein n=1 Tax=Thalassoglobus polymorphus TaxID=2527994 RepID=UPI001E5130EE|nr:hypothetical protein [Thalassoglobus polymorphus]
MIFARPVFFFLESSLRLLSLKDDDIPHNPIRKSGAFAMHVQVEEFIFGNQFLLFASLMTLNLSIL